MRIALPEGFKYRTFSPAGAVMSDGHQVPLAHDGMGVFNTAGRASSGSCAITRIATIRALGSTAVDANSYDTKGGGGTTTLVVNPFTRELERDFISLSGTTVNCAGGVTPWDSWITCEETNAGTPSGWLKQHGYCFDVPAWADSSVPAVAIPSMGRFSHEAVAVDPNTWIVYETEDNGGGGGSSGFYRFLPNKPGVLVDGGQLQMLAIEDRFQYDARNNQTIGVALPVTWVDIANPNPPGTSATAVFNQGRALGGARFRRLEGCWWGNGAVYFADTSGGNAGVGTVWEFRPQGDGGTLTLIFESSGVFELDFPDNLAVSPQGALLLCEDGGGDAVHARRDARRQHLRFRREPARRTRMGRRDVRRGRHRVERPQDSRQPSPARRPMGSHHAVRQPPGRDRRQQPAGGRQRGAHLRNLGPVGRRRLVDVGARHRGQLRTSKFELRSSKFRYRYPRDNSASAVFSNPAASGRSNFSESAMRV